MLVYTSSTVYGDPKLIISEVATNFEGDSFIELYSPSGISKETPLFYGVAVLSVVQRKVAISALFELPKSGFQESSFYFTIGTPKGDWINERSSRIGIPYDDFGPQSHAKLFGRTQNWLNVNTLKSIIVIESDTSFSEQWPIVENNQKSPIIYLDNVNNMKLFLTEKQIDGIILKNHHVVRGCASLFACIPHKLTPKHLFATLGSGWTTDFSKNRCTTSKPFDHSVYFDGIPTPGYQNDCSKKQWKPDITKFLNAMPSPEVPSNACPSNFDMHEISDDQVDADNLAQDHFDTIAPSNEPSSSTSEQASSPDVQQPSSSTSEQASSPDVQQPSSSRKCFHTDLGPEIIIAKKGETKRARLAAADLENNVPLGTLTPNPPGTLPPPPPPSPLTPTEQERKSKVEEAVNIIKQHQSDKLRGQLILDRYWRWFNYIYDEFEPEDSRFNCEFCAKHLQNSMHSNALSTVDGILNEVRDSNMNALRRHESLESHKLAMQLARIEWAEELGFVIARDVKNLEVEGNKITNRHIKLVFYAAKRYQSFNAHPALVELLETETEMGTGCRTPEAAKRMALFMSDLFKKDLFIIMRKSTSPIFLIVDGSEDLAQNHYFVVIFQWIGKFFPSKTTYRPLGPPSAIA